VLNGFGFFNHEIGLGKFSHEPLSLGAQMNAVGEPWQKDRRRCKIRYIFSPGSLETLLSACKNNHFFKNGRFNIFKDNISAQPVFRGLAKETSHLFPWR
jgi:hypothetical protein